MKTHQIVIQNASEDENIPNKKQLIAWAKHALSQTENPIEVTIRIVDQEEMQELNKNYRKKSGPTNVLSFPFSVPDDIKLDIEPIGDIVICANVVNQEASAQNKTQNAHWAHMVIHGILHLLGYDHENDKDAERMESLEINLLQKLDFPNPYEHGEHFVE